MQNVRIYLWHSLVGIHEITTRCRSNYFPVCTTLMMVIWFGASGKWKKYSTPMYNRTRTHNVDSHSNQRVNVVCMSWHFMQSGGWKLFVPRIKCKDVILINKKYYMKPFCVIMSQLFVHYTLIQFANTYRERKKDKQNQKNRKFEGEWSGGRKSQKMRYSE